MRNQSIMHISGRIAGRSIVLLFSLFLAALNCRAEAGNSGFLYRVDTRPPDEIFSSGFSSFGSNENVVEHAKGRSCVGGNRTSAFISTTADYQYARNYALRLMSQTPGHVAYIYEIRSTDTIYRMSLTLRALGQSGESSVSTAEAQSEWIAHASIPANTIRFAHEFTGTGSDPVIRRNDVYEERDPSIQFRTFPSIGAAPPGRNLLTSLTPLVGLCMAALGNCFRRQARSAADDVLICPLAERFFTKEAIVNLISIGSPMVLRDEL